MLIKHWISDWTLLVARTINGKSVSICMNSELMVNCCFKVAYFVLFLPEICKKNVEVKPLIRCNFFCHSLLEVIIGSNWKIIATILLPNLLIVI